MYMPDCGLTLTTLSHIFYIWRRAGGDKEEIMNETAKKYNLTKKDLLKLIENCGMDQPIAIMTLHDISEGDVLDFMVGYAAEPDGKGPWTEHCWLAVGIGSEVADYGGFTLTEFENRYVDGVLTAESVSDAAQRLEDLEGRGGHDDVEALEKISREEQRNHDRDVAPGIRLGSEEEWDDDETWSEGPLILDENGDEKNMDPHAGRRAVIMDETTDYNYLTAEFEVAPNAGSVE